MWPHCCWQSALSAHSAGWKSHKNGIHGHSTAHVVDRASPCRLRCRYLATVSRKEPVRPDKAAFDCFSGAKSAYRRVLSPILLEKLHLLLHRLDGIRVIHYHMKSAHARWKSFNIHHKICKKKKKEKKKEKKKKKKEKKNGENIIHKNYFHARLANSIDDG